jgi:hypothetical protein
MTNHDKPHWTLLAARWPTIFDLTNPRPLNLPLVMQGLEKSGFDHNLAMKALATYFCTDEYRMTLQAGATKIDLEGQPVGTVKHTYRKFVKPPPNLSTNYYFGEGLKTVGYWKSEDEPNFPDPQLLVCNDIEEKPNIIEYLDSGIICEFSLGYSYCRFDCGIPEDKMGDSDLTDGIWVWPQGLSHYVSLHNVQLPSEFINFMKSNKWKVQYELANKFKIEIE